MPTRRTILKGLAVTAATAGTGGSHPARAEGAEDTKLKGRVKQSIVFWCFNGRGEKWSAEKTCEVAKELGVPSVEVMPPEHWPLLKKHGLTCALAPNGMPGMPFMRGFNNPQFHAENLERTGRMIDACADARFPSVITFVGYKWRNPDDPTSGAIPQDEAARNCVNGLKELARHAERK